MGRQDLFSHFWHFLPYKLLLVVRMVHLDSRNHYQAIQADLFPPFSVFLRSQVLQMRLNRDYSMITSDLDEHSLPRLVLLHLQCYK